MGSYRCNKRFWVMKSEACFPRSLVTRNERGSSMVEYVLLASLLAMSVIGVVSVMSAYMELKFTRASIEIGNAGSICQPPAC